MKKFEIHFFYHIGCEKKPLRSICICASLSFLIHAHYYAGQDVDIDEGRRRAREEDNQYILLVVDGKGRHRIHQAEYAVDAQDRTTSTWTRFINEPRGTERETRNSCGYNQPIHVVTTRSIAVIYFLFKCDQM